MKIIIIGGGKTGLILANLLGEEHELVIVEREEKVAKEIAGKTQALVIQGDGSDISLLQEAGLKGADALIATTDDKTNLMISQIAKSEEVEKIIAIVNDPKNEELFTKLGIHLLVSSVGTNVTAIKRLLYQVGEARIIAQLGGGEVQIVELNVAEKSPLIGRKPNLKKASIAAIYRGGDIIIPKESSIIEKGDLLVVFVKTKDLPRITELISGE
ncbi:MAG: NAD-binding protein [Candidatus Peregrinibacteria bacterium]|nr:NAD-binding protein [Candidatus Peregrinibacteria bacterium]